MTSITDNISNALSDTAITTKIKAKLAADSITSAYKVSVETNKGVVTISGKVPNQNAIDRTIDIVSDTDGVRDIINELSIGK